ncbi:molybdenum cofactor guanylyltransferase MobA [uncultured Kiloniella sp.]|uniref:molybdenum cofactor guanylyltransferase MobA n=1 Tax=uncultured Kiloniella sp. TaxID=1133091 RepID=UPI00260B7FAE|nr:molybdenum cofactor guanylyltransferase MobA [uncultured Kiloniella sp.]
MTDVAGVILAGGLARRMGGGDKGMKSLAGESLLTRIIKRIKPQVGPLVLNANGDSDRFKAFSLPVAADVVDDNPGPLAGVLTGLEWVARHSPDAKWMVSVPCDAPFVPVDLVERLVSEASKQNLPLACAMSHGRTHPVVGLWSVALRDDLRQAIVHEEMRKVDRWTERHGICHVSFDDVVIGNETVDPFFNANKLDDLLKVESLLRE